MKKNWMQNEKSSPLSPRTILISGVIIEMKHKIRKVNLKFENPKFEALSYTERSLNAFYKKY